MSVARGVPAVSDDAMDKVFRAGTELAYVCVLSFLWLVASLPVITVPAATVGVHATLVGHLADGERRYVAPFWSAFARSFRRVTLPGLALLGLTGVFAFNAWYYLVVRDRTASTIVLAAAQLVLLGLALAFSAHLYGLWGRWQVDWPAAPRPRVRDVLGVVRGTPWWSLATVAVSVGVPAALVLLHLWQLVPFVVGAVCWVNTRILIRAHAWA